MIRDNNIQHHCASKSCGFQIKNQHYNTPANNYFAGGSRDLFLPFRIHNLILGNDGKYYVQNRLGNTFRDEADMPQILAFFHKKLPPLKFGNARDYYVKKKTHKFHRWIYNDNEEAVTDRWGFDYLYKQYQILKEKDKLEEFMNTEEMSDDSSSSGESSDDEEIRSDD